MGYHSDPTASQALGGINHEFSRLEKKARHLRKLQDEGKLTPEALNRAKAQYRGIYRHVLDRILTEERTPAEERR